MIALRPATRTDAPVMSRILIASIRELCQSDHDNDPERLAGWLANKSPERIALWFDNPGTQFVLAFRNDDPAAVGGFDASRTIIVNYVAPDHRFAGVSKALLAGLEQMLGAGEAHLSSTGTARRFYQSRGWNEAGPPESWRGMWAYPMRKSL